METSTEKVHLVKHFRKRNTLNDKRYYNLNRKSKINFRHHSVYNFLRKSYER